MKWAQGIDKFGLFLYLLLCGFAVANIYSVEPASGIRQGVWLGVSLFVGLIIFLVRAKFFENMAGIIYIIGVLLLIGLFPFGTEILGQKNWYKFGPVSLQPVEFAKIGTALLLANYVSGPDFNLKYKKSLWSSRMPDRFWFSLLFLLHSSAKDCQAMYLWLVLGLRLYFWWCLPLTRGT